MSDIFPAKVVSCLGDAYDHKKVVINRGSNDGIKIGQSFLIYAIGDEIFDPDTNGSLGRLEVVRGRGYVTHVQDKIATITSKDRKEYRYKYPNPLITAIMKIQNEPFKVQEGEIIPFDDVQVGDFAKPI